MFMPSYPFRAGMLTFNIFTSLLSVGSDSVGDLLPQHRASVVLRVRAHWGWIRSAWEGFKGMQMQRQGSGGGGTRSGAVVAQWTRVKETGGGWGRTAEREFGAAMRVARRREKGWV